MLTFTAIFKVSRDVSERGEKHVNYDDVFFLVGKLSLDSKVNESHTTYARAAVCPVGWLIVQMRLGDRLSR